MPSYFKDKVALITGSSSGIGAATAVALAKKGCNVTITGRDKKKLKSIEEKCKKNGVKVVAKLGDVMDVDHLKDLVEMTEAQLGPIDILVNNAGFMANSDLSLTSGTLIDFDKTMGVNVRSVLILTKIAIPSLKKTKGCVINISSAGSVKFVPNWMFYQMSKSAIDYMTKAAAVELAPFKIRVNGINPGGVRTSFADNIGGSTLTKEQSKQLWDHAGRTMHPLGRIGEPAEIAQAVLYLACHSTVLQCMAHGDGSSSSQASSDVITIHHENGSAHKNDAEDEDKSDATGSEK